MTFRYDEILQYLTNEARRVGEHETARVFLPVVGTLKLTTSSKVHLGTIQIPQLEFRQGDL